VGSLTQIDVKLGIRLETLRLLYTGCANIS